MESYTRDNKNITCDVASNGREAVQMYKERHSSYDVCIMDAQMAVMDGYEATRMIRQWEQEENLGRIQILGLSADANTAARKKGADSGMDQFEVNVAYFAVCSFL